MKTLHMNYVWAWCCLALLLPSLAWAALDEDVETGKLVAILLDTGRVTVGKNQALINDPGIGNKGFTSDVFEQQLIQNFQQRTGINLADLSHAPIPEKAKPLLARLVTESKKTIDTYQTVINLKGVKYKGLIPATFGTETAKRFQAWSGFYLKQTAPDHLLRNKRNKADQFELATMKRFAQFATPKKDDGILHEVVDGGKTLRVMLPLFFEKPCLICHGKPKGERDISGYKREGGSEGELGGAISVKIPLK